MYSDENSCHGNIYLHQSSNKAIVVLVLNATVAISVLPLNQEVQCTLAFIFLHISTYDFVQSTIFAPGIKLFRILFCALMLNM